jgi:hypothetical protein
MISHDELKEVLKLLEVVSSGQSSIKYTNPYSATLKLNTSPHSTSKSFSHTYRTDIDLVINNIKGYFATEHMENSCKLIVFNEMFFSQKLPLNSEQMDFINEKILRISERNAFSIFFVNFLYTKVKNEEGRLTHRAYQTMVDKYNNWHMAMETPDVLLIDCKSNLNVPKNNTKNDVLYLKNETFGINNGHILTGYKKATYFKESDDTIRSGDAGTYKYAIYDFGTGQDKIITNSQLSEALVRNVTTEICFDLANGIRCTSSTPWKNKSTWPQSNIHIIQSNCIDPTEYDNCSFLPQNELIIYVDRLMSQNCTLAMHDSIVLKENNADLFQQRLFEVRIGKSNYKIRIFKI